MASEGIFGVEGGVERAGARQEGYYLVADLAGPLDHLFGVRGSIGILNGVLVKTPQYPTPRRLYKDMKRSVYVVGAERVGLKKGIGGSF